jgi:hypothetical protein
MAFLIYKIYKQKNRLSCQINLEVQPQQKAGEWPEQEAYGELQE